MHAIEKTAGAAIQHRDLEGLYRSLSGQLERIVRSDVRAPDTLIEDACQVA